MCLWYVIVASTGVYCLMVTGQKHPGGEVKFSVKVNVDE